MLNRLYSHPLLRSRSVQRLLATIAGASMVLGFAPFYAYLVPLIAIAVLVWAWANARSTGDAAGLGWCFGIGMYATGLYWLLTTLHEYVEMSWALTLLAYAGLCVFMASFTAANLWLAKRYQQVWLIPLLWGLGDWLKANISDGFPWLVLGYSQIPNSPLAGYLALCGIYVLSMLVASLAVCLYQIVNFTLKTLKHAAPLPLRTWQPFIWMIVSFSLGAFLNSVQWTTPQGEPIKVALLQGNVDQHAKWSKENSQRILHDYVSMISQQDAQLILLPETAIPFYISDIQAEIQTEIARVAREKRADILLGLLDWRRSDIGAVKLNAALSVGVSGQQRHHKTHLVPFGEFIPAKPLFAPLYHAVFHVPHSDFERGTYKQLFNFQGVYAAVSICYEEMFGDELLSVSKHANMLISMSNGAWFGNTLALPQYLQFSQARAIENQKPVLRVSNNGMTALIDPHGWVLNTIPINQSLVLNVQVQPYQGKTPFVTLKNGLFWLLLLLGWVWMITKPRRMSKKIHN